jgi:hypothetical protein
MITFSPAISTFFIDAFWACETDTANKQTSSSFCLMPSGLGMIKLEKKPNNASKLEYPTG